MDITGTYTIAAPRQAVWQALNDEAVLKQCIPGCESIQRLSPTEWTAVVAAKVGPVKAKFSGKITFKDIDPPNGYTISGTGTGGAAGFAKGDAKVTLTDAPGGTELSYAVNAAVGGKLAQVGARLIESTARKLSDEFFAQFAAITGGTAPTQPAASSVAASDGPRDGASKPEPQGRGQAAPVVPPRTGPRIRPLYVGLLLAAVAAAAFAFLR